MINYVIGATVNVGGRDLIVATRYPGRRGGWLSVLLTEDGEPVVTFRQCVCEPHDNGRVGYDLVTEAEFTYCVTCRRMLP